MPVFIGHEFGQALYVGKCFAFQTKAKVILKNDRYQPLKNVSYIKISLCFALNFHLRSAKSRQSCILSNSVAVDISVC